MRHYPKGRRRINERPQILEEDRAIAREFGFDYFDGERRFGYGGFNYHPRFWTETVRLMSEHYSLQPNASILDVGCAKGFMLTDFRLLLPESFLCGIDVSEYAASVAHESVCDSIQVGNATYLPFDDEAFDLVISINTLHNLDRDGVFRALQEINRVSRGNSFVMVDGWKSDREKSELEAWVLTPRTMLSADDWVELFDEANYFGDYCFWSP